MTRTLGGFVILSETHSGAEYLRDLVGKNFGLTYRQQIDDDVLCIVLARNPLEWIRALRAVTPGADLHEAIQRRTDHYRRWLAQVHERILVNYENLPEDLRTISETHNLPLVGDKIVDVANPDKPLDGEAADIVCDDVMECLDLSLERQLRYHLRLDGDHEVMSVLGKTDFVEFVVVVTHPSLEEWSRRLCAVLSHFHSAVRMSQGTESCGDWREDVLYFLFSPVRREEACQEWKGFPSYFVLLQHHRFPSSYFDEPIVRMMMSLAQETWDVSAANTRRIRRELGRSNYYHVPFPTRGADFDDSAPRDMDVLIVDFCNQDVLTSHCEQQGYQYEICEDTYLANTVLYRRTKIAVTAFRPEIVIPALECGCVVLVDEISDDIQCDRLIVGSFDEMIPKIDEILNQYELPSRATFSLTPSPGVPEQLRRLRSVSDYGRTTDLPLLGLHMIVRDESRTLRHTLPHLVDLYDYFIFVDTGSVDDTIAYLLDFFETLPRDKKGIVVQRKWIDEFDQSRNESLRLCRGRVQYAMTLDADDYLHIECPTKMRNILQQTRMDCYRISMNEAHQSIYYNRCALVSAMKPFVYRFKLHESVWPAFRHGQVGVWPRENMHIERGLYRGCRSRQGNVPQRDIAILRRCLKTEPEIYQSRYCFYLAQTYFAVRDWKRAFKYYIKRAHMGNFIDEIYICLWRAAICLEKLEKPTTCIIRLLDQASALIPDRIEAIHKKVQILRKEKQFRRGFYDGLKGLEKSWRPSMEYGYRETYRYRLIDEVTVCGTFCDELPQSHLLLMGLLRAVPPDEFQPRDLSRIRQNRDAVCYARPTLAVYAGHLDSTILRILPILSQDGFDVYVFSCSNSFRDVKDFESTVLEQPKQRFDAVIVYRCVDYFLIAKKSWAACTYVWLRATDLQEPWPNFRMPANKCRVLSRNVDDIHSVVVHSQWQAKEISTVCPEIVSKLRVIPSGFDLQRCVSLASKQRGRFTWPFPFSRGFEDTYRLFFWFKYNLCPEASLHVYGPTSSAHIPSEYARDRNRLEGVTFHGTQTDDVIDETLISTDIVIFPQAGGAIYSEIVRAMAAGVLVICSAASDLPEMISNEHGYRLDATAELWDYCVLLRRIYKEDDADAIRQNATRYARMLTHDRCGESWFRLLTRSAHLYGGTCDPSN